MGYCVEADVQIAAGGPAKLLELLDQDANGAADAGVLDAAIERACSRMDTYLVKQYLVPVSPGTDELKWRAAEIAVLFLRSAKGTTGDEHDKAQEAHTKWLEDVRDGKIALDAAPQPTRSTMRTDKTGINVRDTSRDKLKGFW